MGVSGMLAGKYLGNVYDEVTEEMNIKYAGAVPLPVWMQGTMSEEEKGKLRPHARARVCVCSCFQLKVNLLETRLHHAPALRRWQLLCTPTTSYSARGCVHAAALAKKEITEDMKKKWLELSRLEEQIYLEQRASRKLA